MNKQPGETLPKEGAAASGTSGKKTKTWGWFLAIAVIVGLGYAVYWRLNNQTAQGPGGRGGLGGRPMPVQVEKVRKADLDIRIPALGTVTPLNMVTVRSRVDGHLMSVAFKEGQYVKEGDLLAEIDARPYEVQKAEAEAQQAKDQALLSNAKLDAARFRSLLAEDSVSKQQVDSQDALVRQYEAAVRLDQAQVESAALQVSYARVTAPVSGRLGLRQVDVGNVVRASDSTGLVVITQLHPISVVFAIPQDYLPKLMKRFRAGEAMAVDAYARDGKTKLGTGRLVTVDNQIDQSTGTVKLRAEFSNDDEALFPNQFVNVELSADKVSGATVVSSSAVQTGVVGTYVYVVGQDQTVAVRTIQTGTVQGDLVEVLKGLSPGDTVVTDGVDKLRDGASIDVVVRNGSADNARPAGTPERQGKRRPHEGGQAPKKE